MRSNIKSWSLAVGILIILGACILSYMLTQPVEADVSMLDAKPSDVSIIKT